MRLSQGGPTSGSPFLAHILPVELFHLLRMQFRADMMCCSGRIRFAFGPHD